MTQPTPIDLNAALPRHRLLPPASSSSFSAAAAAAATGSPADGVAAVHIGLHISRVGVGRSPLLERSSYFCIASFLLWWRRCLRNRHRGNRSMLRSAWISGQTNVAAASEHNSLPATTTQHTVRVFMFDFRPFDMKLCRQDQITGLSGTTSACWRRTAATFAYWNDQRSQYWQSVFM